MSRARSASDPTSPPGGHSEKVAGPSRAAALRPASPRENPSASSHARAGPSGQAVGAAGQASVQAGSSGAERYKDRSKVKRDTAWQRDSARRRDTPPSPLAYYPSHPSPALTQAALSALASAPPLTRPSYPYPFAHHSFPAGAQADTQTGTGRLNADESSGSSSTSHEGDGDDMDGASRVTPEVDEDIKRWAEAGVVGVDRKGKGKAKAVEVGGVDTLPGEILMQVFGNLDTKDLLNALKVNKTWCLSAFPLLWTRPSIRDTAQLASVVRVLMTPATRLTLPYANYVRRISLVALGLSLTDDLLLGLSACKRVERLTLTGASSISNAALRTVIAKMPDLVAIDLGHTDGTDHTVLQALGDNCPRLNGLNLTECKGADARGIKAIAEGCRGLRRLKLAGCHRQTDTTVAHLVHSCPLLIELDISRIAQLTDASLQAIWLNSAYIKEIKMNGNDAITDDAFLDYTEGVDEDIAYTKLKLDGISMSLTPKEYTLEHLRALDFTGCTQITDKAIERLVKLAPRIRSLTLAKCTRLTDEALEHICKLGRHLHYLHLGHVESITDRSVTRLARACTRVRYLDIGCCPLLTDLAVMEIAASMTKLHRLGLVKMALLTDDGLIALTERRQTLDRIHLSYCEQITLWGMQHFLNRMSRLAHMSLTGIAAFKTEGCKQFSKEPPNEFNEHQRKSFNVFGTDGIKGLRHWLNNTLVLYPHSVQSTRRGSYSSASSFTAPNGNSSPTEQVYRNAPYGYVGPGQPSARLGSAQESYYDEDTQPYDYSFAYGLYSDPPVATPTAGPSYATNRAAEAAYIVPVVGTGLEAAFASTIPDFLTGTQNLSLSDEPASMGAREQDRRVSADRSDRGWPRIPGAYVSGRGSRTSSISSVDTRPEAGISNVPSGSASVRRGSRQTSAAAAFQAQYIADQGRNLHADSRGQPGPSAPPGLARVPSYRQRAHTTSSPLASNSFARSSSTILGSTGPSYRSTRMRTTDSTSSIPSNLQYNRQTGGHTARGSSSTTYHPIYAQQYPSSSSHNTHQVPRSSSSSRAPAPPSSFAPSGPHVQQDSRSMDRTRERSGSGSSFSSLTEGLRGLGLRRTSVSQVVQAAVEGSPLRWVAEMVGWNPDEQGHGTAGGGNGANGNGTGMARGEGQYRRDDGGLGGDRRGNGGRRGTTG